MTTYDTMYFEDDKGTLTAAGENAVATGISVLLDAVTANNYEKGWRPRPEDMPMGKVTRNVGETLMLITSEVAEAFEAHRNNEPMLWFEYDTPAGKTGPAGGFAHRPSIDGETGETLGKPQGMASELADVIIRVLDMAQEFDIPVIDAVINKHAYNQTRPYRHGNKAC